MSYVDGQLPLEEWNVFLDKGPFMCQSSRLEVFPVTHKEYI